MATSATPAAAVAATGAPAVAVAPAPRSRTGPAKEVYEGGQASSVGPLLRKPAATASTAVTESTISVSGAKQKFVPAELNTDRQNYADELRPKMLGAQRSSAPFELAGVVGPSARPAETKFQRFQRLQADVKALLDEINADVVATADAKASEEPLPSYVHKELKALHTQLERALADADVRSVLTPSSGSFLGLSSSVQDTVSRAAASVHAGDGTAPTATSVTYELYAVPGTRDQSLAALERRLARLEQCVGRATDGLPLWDEIQTVKAALDTLEATRLDDIAGKLRAAAEAVASYERERRINPTAAGSSVASPAISEAQVTALLEAVGRWDAFASSLPTIVARLRALRDLHEDAARFSQSVARVEAEQSAITALLHSGMKSLAEVQGGFDANAAAMHNSLDAIQKRIDALSSAK